MEEDKYWEPAGPGDAWSPVHAVHILGAMRPIEFLEDLVRLLKERADDLGDWLTEDVPSILANFGPEAVETLKALIQDERADTFLRSSAVRALCVIAKKHEKLRADTLQFLRNLVASSDKEDSEFVSLIIDHLAQFKDPEALRYIKDAFRRRIVDSAIVDLRYVEEIYRAADETLEYHRDDVNPLQHFSPKNIRYLQKVNYETGREMGFSRFEPNMKKKKVGRNDPCPCGSGKKYKKCCLKIDRL